MRASLVNKQVVIVRPLQDQAGDNMGDAPIILDTTRGSSFDMPMQVMHTQGNLGDSGTPGREQNFVAVARMLKREIPPGAPDSWKSDVIGPQLNDVVELIGGRKLFVVGQRPAFPKSPRLGAPSGKWDGWEINLNDQKATMTAAGQYPQ